MAVQNGRYTVNKQDEITVFLIGMRINKWWAIHKWLPVFMAMTPMVKELYTKKDLGFISMSNFFGWRTTLMIQYWRSEEELFAYAKNSTHLKAWRDYNKKIGDSGSVGIYHETYSIKEGQYEAIYGNMPPFGLGKALGLQALSPSTHSAKKRFKQKNN